MCESREINFELNSKNIVRGKNFIVFGKSIALESGKKGSSFAQNNASVQNPMKHFHRIKQLYSTVCQHEFKHEIANHYRSVKYKNRVKNRIKHSLSMYKNRLRNKKHKNLSVAKTTFSMAQRKALRKYRPSISKRQILHIPSFTFPRY